MTIFNRLFFAVILLFLSIQLVHSKQFFKGYEDIVGLMKSGQFFQAEKKLNLNLSKKGITNQEKYTSQLLLNKIYLNKQDFGMYGAGVKRLLKTAKSLPQIYQAEAYAHQSYYWHYYMWQDSALIYANKSMKFFQKNRSKRNSIETAFVYEVYAITFLYRKSEHPIDFYRDIGISDQKRWQFLYFDSALYYMKGDAFTFDFDESMLYRSYANRWLDLVLSSHKNGLDRNPQDKHLMTVSFSRANNLYDKALSCLKPWNYNDFLLVSALKGCIHTYSGKLSEARSFFKSQLKKIPSNLIYNREKIAYNPLVTFLTFKVRNDIKLPFSQPDFEQNTSIIHNLKADFWNSFRNSELPYDSYRTSPYINLFNLYLHASDFGKSDPKLFEKGVSYLITVKSYYHFLEQNSIFEASKLPNINVSSIQQKLKENECYLLLYDTNDLMENSKIMITRSEIHFIKSSNSSFLNYSDPQSIRFKDFLKEAHSAYLAVFSSVINSLPNVKKVYVDYDDQTHYDLFVKDTLATDFSNTEFLGQQINFVKIYDPVRYFSGGHSMKNLRIDARMLKQRDEVNNQLFFMPEFFDQFSSSFDFTNDFLRSHFIKELDKGGILHLYGHGELATNNEAYTRFFQLTYKVQNSNMVINKLNTEKKVNRDLVVLNNCFSGYPFFNKNEFDKTIPLHLLSNGCSAIINSPGKVDDYYSAEFFKTFYEQIQEGILFEDAFFNAKRTFFNRYPEHRNPEIWNALQLIQSKKIKIQREPNYSGFYFAGYILFVILDFVGVLIYVIWLKRYRALAQN